MKFTYHIKILYILLLISFQIRQINSVANCSNLEKCKVLSVSANQRHLKSGEKPFFWLGDTGWLLLSKLSREEAEDYFDNRVENGFNMIQIMVLHTLKTVNYYGDSALIDGNIAYPNLRKNSGKTTPGYWEYLDELVAMAEKKGLYLAMVPVWGSNVKSGKVNSDQAAVYAEFLANRYRNNPNIIWLNGGDLKGSDSTNVWLTIGKTLHKYDPEHLITFHPFGRTQSSDWFHNEDWLDFNMFQSGHRSYEQDSAADSKKFGEDNWRYVAIDYAKTPAKPTLDGEPSYEGIPKGLHDTLQPRWTDNDIRRYAWWSVFSGGCGFTYGHNSVMQFYKTQSQAGAYGARQSWDEALNSAGAKQMKHLKYLAIKYGFHRLIPAAEKVTDQGIKYDYQPVLIGENLLLVYTYNGRSISLDTEATDLKKGKFSWYSPRTGEQSKKKSIQKNQYTFNPPGEVQNGNDWVLIIEMK